MKKYIKSGVRPSENNQYIIDYTYNLPEDIIDIQPPQLYKSEHGNHIYWFGYKFKDNISRKQRTDFIHHIKGLTENPMDDRTLSRFIELPLQALDEKINLYNIDCFVYPLSGRSQLVTKIVREINRWTSRDMCRASYELVKSVPSDVQFDWAGFESVYGDDTNRYNQMCDYVKNELMPKIHQLDYFSLAQSVKPKYRPYIQNFLSFASEDKETIEKLQGSNILVVDDINTSGSTLDEILRILGKINSSCNIYVYTLIGN